MKKLLQKVNSKWARLAVLILVGVNSVGMIYDMQLLPFSNQELAAGVSVVAMVISELWNHWKNNSYTEKAQHADAYLKSIK